MSRPPNDSEPRPEPPTSGAPAPGFAQQYAEVAPALWSWASLHVRPALRSRLDPEDVLQEVACRGFQRYGEFDPELGSFRGWLFGIARNVLGTALTKLARGGGNRGPDWSTGSWTQVPDDATRVTQRVARDERLANFIVWVESLPDEERRLILYRGLEGWSFDQVGDLLEIGGRAASKRWDRLRERLRENAPLQELFEA